jgi:hypothetical protein
MAGKKKNKKDAVNFYSYSKLLFAWPLIAIGVLFWFIAGDDPSAYMSEVLGWIYIFAVLIVILTIGVDIERNYAFVWLVIFAMFFFLGRWLQDAQQITVFGNIYEFFNSREVRYDRGLGLSLAVLLAVPYAVMLLWARIQHKWRITYNEFEHYSWGRADDSLARGAKRVRSSYPDLLELLLAGAGTLVVYSATGRSELRRIRHVPLLPLLRWRINKILETTQVTTTSDQAYQRSIEEEEAAQEEEEGSIVHDDEESPAHADDTGLPGGQERL